MATESQLDKSSSSPQAQAAPRSNLNSQPSRSKYHFPTLLPALATGGLLWLGHFPMAWSWFAWFALVPLLCLVRSPARPRRIYLCAWLGGVAFFFPALQWMRVADERMLYTWLALALYCSLYFPLWLAFLRRLDRWTPLPLVITAPVVWTALDYLRGILLTGFPWYYLGHTQHDHLAIIQMADLAGVYAVTFVIVAVNALLFELLYRWDGFRRFFALPSEPALPARSRLSFQAIGVALLLVSTLGYGIWRLGQNEFEPGPRIALVQGNLEQGVRNQLSSPNPGRSGEFIRDHYFGLNALAAAQQPKPDLIVWPETSYPYEWTEFASTFPAEYVKREYREIGPNGEDLTLLDRSAWQVQVLPKVNAELVNEIRKHGIPSLLGLNTWTAEGIEETDKGLREKGKRFNAGVFMLGDGQYVGRYDKIVRVPFGEYVPFREVMPWLSYFTPYDFDYSITAGERYTRFPLGKYHFGVVICYEDTISYLARQYVRTNGEPKVDFLLNISNDGWFNGTCEHEEHLAICRFRAIECRRSVVRAVNMGISAVIDGNGRVLAPNSVREAKQGMVWEIDDMGRGAHRPLQVSRWHEYKKVHGVLVANIPIDHRDSLYAQWGDWLPSGCWLFVGGGLVWGWLRRRKDTGGSANRR